MSSPDPSVFFPESICLEKLDDWTVLDVLKQVRRAGYRGNPSKPVLFYRKALWNKMKKNEPKDGERFNDAFLAAEKAYNASAYDLKLLQFTSSEENKLDQPSPLPPAAPKGILESRRIRPASLKKDTSRGNPSASTTLHVPAYRPKSQKPSKPPGILSGFISRSPSKNKDIPELILPKPDWRKRVRGYAEFESERPSKVAKSSNELEKAPPRRKYKY